MGTVSSLVMRNTFVAPVGSSPTIKKSPFANEKSAGDESFTGSGFPHGCGSHPPHERTTRIGDWSSPATSIVFVASNAMAARPVRASGFPARVWLPLALIASALADDDVPP